MTTEPELDSASTVVGTATGPTSTGPLLVGVDVGGTKIAVLITTPDGVILGRATRASSGGRPGWRRRGDRHDRRDRHSPMPARTSTTSPSSASASPAGSTRGPATSRSRSISAGRTSPCATRSRRDSAGPCVIENDARAAAVGLHRRRVLGSADDIAYLAVGTGIAAGVILDGRLHRGARGLAGEIGHAIADSAGPVCTCGQRGCLEALVSGPSIARRAATPSRAMPAGRDLAVDPAGRAHGDRRLRRRDRAAIRSATDLVEDVGRQLAWAIHLLVMAYDVDRVVLGGGVSHAGETFMAPIQRELDRLRAASPIAGELLPRRRRRTAAGGRRCRRPARSRSPNRRSRTTAGGRDGPAGSGTHRSGGGASRLIATGDPATPHARARRHHEGEENKEEQ